MGDRLPNLEKRLPTHNPAGQDLSHIRGCPRTPQRAFPYACNAPTAGGERLHCGLISGDIPGELSFPEIRSSRGVSLVPAAFVTVPEAAVHAQRLHAATDLRKIKYTS